MAMGRQKPGYNKPPPKLEPAQIQGRPPPHNLDAEAAVLSALLLVRHALDAVRPFLQPDRFYSDAHRKIYEAILALAADGLPIDIITVLNYLRDREWLAAVGGPSYLAQISDATPAAIHVGAHAQIVFDCWLTRQQIAINQKYAAEGYGDVGVRRSFLMAQIQELTDLAAKAGIDDKRPRRIDHLIRAEMGRLARQHDRPHEFGGTNTGFSKFDRKTSGLHEGDLLIVAARPGQGKTSLVLNMGVNIAIPPKPEDPITVPETGVILFSLEMPREQLIMRALCAEARVDLTKYRQVVDLQPRDWGFLHEAADRLARANIWIDDTPALTVPEITAKIRALQNEFNRPATFTPCPKCRGPYAQMDGVAAWFCPTCVPDPTDPQFEQLIRAKEPEQLTRERKLAAAKIDYLQLIKGTGNEQNREQEVAGISRGLKQLAKELRIPVIALAQLGRVVETRKDKRPQLSDLRESGSIEQDADTIVFIYRPEYYAPETTEHKGMAELIIAKQRNGATGKVWVRFSASCTRFDNLEEVDYPELDGDNDTYMGQG